MEVMIRNLHPESTYDVLKDFLKPYLQRISIESTYLSKIKGKKFAFLTFLHLKDGDKFMKQHGQIRTESGNLIKARYCLMFLNKPIYCEKSNNKLDETALLWLEKEERDRQSKLNNEVNQQISVFQPVILNTTSAACGNLVYIGNELVFAPQVIWNARGSAKFGERSMILKLDCGKRLDFRYEAINEIMVQKSPASILISMTEPPRLFEQQDPLELMLKQLYIKGRLNSKTPRLDGPERKRVSFLDESHKNISGNCLVYRIQLPYVVKNDTLHHDFQRLGRIIQNSHPVEHYVREKKSINSFAQDMRYLLEALSSSQLNSPFEVAFQVQKLAQNNYLTPSIVLTLLPEIKEIYTRSGRDVCVLSIKSLFSRVDYPSLGSDYNAFETQTLIEYLRHSETQSNHEADDQAEYRTMTCQADQHMTLTSSNDHSQSNNEVLIHRAKITPTGMFLYGPEPETANRILRKYSQYHSYFLRVTFCDEDGSPVRQSHKVSYEAIFDGRFTTTLNKGIDIGGRHYEFLGFSHSSLRMQTCWFMAPFISADGGLMCYKQLIHDLGNFLNITCPAKCAARIGQAFSDTSSTIKIKEHNVIADVERNGRVFSDGVGTISLSLRERIYDGLKRKPLIMPTCFQIRYQGAKGMLAVDSTLDGDVLNLRQSMIKFEGSTSDDLEICDTAHRPMPLYLNRQLIKILEDLGVDDEFFLDLQAKEVQRLRMITKSPANASNFLKRQSIGESISLPWLIEELDYLGFEFENDGFLRDVLEVALLCELRQLKHKTRIPVEKGWHLHGVMDETGLLEEGEIFCTVLLEGQTQIVTGDNLIISRSPALHPGDVQVVTGVTPPPESPLWQLSNCICFSQKGDRDLPSQLSGGDLDGDRFAIIYDENAKLKRTEFPADYPRPQPMNIGRPVEREDMTKFFIQFMKSDQLGQIAVNHRVLADAKKEGTLHEDCITLAEMHSTAVDFSKTGIPVDMSRFPKRPKFRPDFEAPGPHVHILKLDGITLEYLEKDLPLGQQDEDDDMPRYRYYESQKILGKLYRAIDERAIFQEICHRGTGLNRQTTLVGEVWKWVRKECVLIQWKHLLGWAQNIRTMYEDSLYNVMTEYSDRPRRPVSELEAFVGSILGRAGAQNRVQLNNSSKMKQRVEENNKFIIDLIVKDGRERSSEALERSMACLAVSLEIPELRRKDDLLSFKYLAVSICLKQVNRFMAGL